MAPCARPTAGPVESACDGLGRRPVNRPVPVVSSVVGRPRDTVSRRRTGLGTHDAQSIPTERVQRSDRRCRVHRLPTLDHLLRAVLSGGSDGRYGVSIPLTSRAVYDCASLTYLYGRRPISRRCPIPAPTPSSDRFARFRPECIAETCDPASGETNRLPTYRTPTRPNYLGLAE